MVMETETEKRDGRGGRREGAGRPPYTIEGLMKKMSPVEAAKFREECRRYALRLLIRWARAELLEDSTLRMSE
ncbi:MAG: hypothetical protein ABSD76_06485 [Terriglobales bacterium]|jgi:hypothetical protein